MCYSTSLEVNVCSIGDLAGALACSCGHQRVHGLVEVRAGKGTLTLYPTPLFSKWAKTVLTVCLLIITTVKASSVHVLMQKPWCLHAVVSQVVPFLQLIQESLTTDPQSFDGQWSKTL